MGFRRDLKYFLLAEVAKQKKTIFLAFKFRDSQTHTQTHSGTWVAPVANVNEHL